MDEYIISGNKTQSAINAGYSERTAGQQGHRMLKNVEIQKAMKERSKAMWDEKSMSVAEALAISASIARGEVQQSLSRQTDNETGEVLKDVTYEFVPSVEDRQRSIDHILKVSGAYTENFNVSADVGLEIEVDYGDEEN